MNRPSRRIHHPPGDADEDDRDDVRNTSTSRYAIPARVANRTDCRMMGLDSGMIRAIAIHSGWNSDLDVGRLRPRAGQPIRRSGPADIAIVQ